MPLLYLLFVLYGLVLLATPVLTIALFLRQARLQKQLNKHAEENTKELTRLQRAVGELQARCYSSACDASPRKGLQPRSPPASSRSAIFSTPPDSSPGRGLSARRSAAAQQAAGNAADSRHREKARACCGAKAGRTGTGCARSACNGHGACHSRCTASYRVTTQVASAPGAPSESKPAEPGPVAPATQVPPPAAKPTPPPGPPKIVPPPAVPHSPAMPPPAPATIPPAAAARVATPPPISPLRVPAAKPTLQQRMTSASAIEEALGANWFAKLAVGDDRAWRCAARHAVIQKLRNPAGGAGKALIVFGAAMLLLVGGMVI